MTFKGTCQVGDMIDGATCEVTDVIDIQVLQPGDSKPTLLGQLCLAHAAEWKHRAFPVTSSIHDFGRN